MQSLLTDLLEREKNCTTSIQPAWLTWLMRTDLCSCLVHLQNGCEAMANSLGEAWLMHALNASSAVQTLMTIEMVTIHCIVSWQLTADVWFKNSNHWQREALYNW